MKTSVMPEWSEMAPLLIDLEATKGCKESIEGLELKATSLAYTNHGHQLGFRLVIRNKNDSERKICLGIWSLLGQPLLVKTHLNSKQSKIVSQNNAIPSELLDKKGIQLILKSKEAFAISYYLRDDRQEELGNAKRIKWHVFLNRRHLHGNVPYEKMGTKTKSKF